MIFRLEYKNKALKTARVDIITPTGTGVETVEGTGHPFMLKYEGDKKNKGLMFLSSSAEINIYETPLFNIDTLKTSGEKDIRVNYYIDSVLEWTGFVIPDFFSREIGGDGVVSMVASDRLSVLDSEVLEGLPVTVTLRTLLSSCLAKTGLTLPLKTVVDFATVSGNTSHVLNYSIRSQRLTDTKGRSVNCKDIIKSILVATNSKLMQRKGAWWVVNKMQHELGGGRVYTSPTAFTNYVEDLISFTDVTRGAIRTIAPVAGGVGVFQEYGGGALAPNNYAFESGLSGWTLHNGFTASIDTRRVLGYTQSGKVYTPIYDAPGTARPYLLNRNLCPADNQIHLTNIHTIPHAKASIPVVSASPFSAKIKVEVNATGRGGGSAARFVVMLKRPGRDVLILNRDGQWLTGMGYKASLFATFTGEDLEAVDGNGSYSGTIDAAGDAGFEDDINTYSIDLLIFGSGWSLSDGTTVVRDETVLIHSASVQFSATSNDNPKGTLYKADQGGESYTKIHDTETTVFGDYLTGGLNGYFYNYAPDDTSSLLTPNGSRSQPAWVNTYTQNTEPLPLLQQTIRQMRRMFSVAHDFIKGEIDVADFDPLSIFEDCERRFVIVEAEFDFLRGSLQVVLEEVAYQNLTVREYIYSYFGEGDEGIRGISGISAGSSGGGGGGGMAPEPSWLENEITIDPESGLLSVDGWHVKGDLIIEGQVNQWLAQQLVVDDARIQVNRRQGGATVDSGLVIYNKDTSTEVSSLVYDVDGIWRAGGQRIYTDAYKPLADNATNLGGYSAASYPRKAEAATITGAWTFNNNLTIGGGATRNILLPSTRIRDNNSKALVFSAEGGGSFYFRPDGDASTVNQTLINDLGLSTPGLSVSGTSTLTGNVTAGAQLSSPTYFSGFAGEGWRIDGGAETQLTVDRLTVRGRMDVYELVINKIRATNGSLWVSDALECGTVQPHTTTPPTFNVYPKEGDNRSIPFIPGDIVRGQEFDGKNVRAFTGNVYWVDAGGSFFRVTIISGSPWTGMTLVRIGNTNSSSGRQGSLYLTSSDSNAPYMDVLDGVDSGSFAGKTKVRLGRLDGITDPDLGTLSGYGLYTENGYFKGKITVTGGNAATKEDVDAVQVGGRNLWKNSRRTPTQVTVSQYGYLDDGRLLSEVGIKSGQTVTFAFFVEDVPEGEQVQARVDFYRPDGTYSPVGILGNAVTSEGRSSFTFIVPDLTEFGRIRYRILPVNWTANYTVKVFYEKLELGNRATDWTPAPEDVPSAVDYLAKAIQDGTTDIEGGLVSTNVLMVKDTNGTVRGGMSGLASDNIGFWTGGTYQDAINDNANVILRKDGSARFAAGRINILADGDTTIGDVHVDAGGALVVKDDTYNRVLITKRDVTTLADIEGSSQNTTVNNSADSYYASVGYFTVSQPNTITVNNNGTQLTVTGAFGLNMTTGAGQKDSQSELYVSVYLRKIGDGRGTGVFLSSGSVTVNKLTGESMDDYFYGRSLNKVAIVAAGQYRIVADYTRRVNGSGPHEDDDYLATIHINETSMHALYNGSYQRNEIGKNGIGVISSSFNYSFFGEEGSVYKAVEKVSNATMYDKPGVLFAGNIAADGSLTAGYWGAKYREGSYRESDYVYRIHHDVGHQNYYVLLTPGTNAFVWVVSKEANYVRVRSTLASISFDFAIIGNNQ